MIKAVYLMYGFLFNPPGMANKSKSKKRANKKIQPRNKKANAGISGQRGKISASRNRKGKTGAKPVSKNKGTRSQNPKRKTVRPTAGKQEKIQLGRSEDARQYTFEFPAKMQESRKLGFLRNWNPQPLTYFIGANRIIRSGSDRVFRLTPTIPVIEGKKGAKRPQAVWIKLVKKIPRTRGNDVYFSAVLSPDGFDMTARNVHAFSVGVLEKYYADNNADFNLRADEKIKIGVQKKTKRDPHKLKGSDPDDLDGSPMKVIAVIYHFIY